MNEQPPADDPADATPSPHPGSSPEPSAAGTPEGLTPEDWSAPVGVPYAADAGPDPGPNPAPATAPATAPTAGPNPTPTTPPITAPPPALPLGAGYAPGTNGLAIAALCCGIALFFPITAVLGIIFGIIALNQLRSRTQKGRGFAIAGIVLGAIGTLFWGAVIASVISDGVGPARDTAGKVTTARQVSVDTLRDGDCFDGVPQSDKIALDLVTAKPCTSPHEAQIVTTVTLPAGSFPGEDKVVEMADKTCGDTVGALLVEDEIDKLDLSYIYPGTDFDWRADRSVTCIVSASSGKLSRSVLK